MWSISRSPASTAGAAVRLTWRQLLAARAHGILAVDFADVDTVFPRWAYVLVVIEHVTPRTHLAGITTHPTGHITQQARNLLRLGRLSVLRRDARPGPRPPSTSRAASARGRGARRTSRVPQLNGAPGHADRRCCRSLACAHLETPQTPGTRSNRVRTNHQQRCRRGLRHRACIALRCLDYPPRAWVPGVPWRRTRTCRSRSSTRWCRATRRRPAPPARTSARSATAAARSMARRARTATAPAGLFDAQRRALVLRTSRARASSRRGSGPLCPADPALARATRCGPWPGKRLVSSRQLSSRQPRPGSHRGRAVPGCRPDTTGRLRRPRPCVSSVALDPDGGAARRQGPFAPARGRAAPMRS